MASTTSEYGKTCSAGQWLGAAGLSAAALFTAGKVLQAIRSSRFDLHGKVVLITGSRGLGLALAQELGSAGARLALCARDAEELNRGCAQLWKSGIEATSFPGDILDQNQIADVLQRVIDHYGGIDVLVNNAGEIQVGPYDCFTKEDFEHSMNLMFWAPVNLTFAVLPHFRSRGRGDIVNITSVGGRVSVPHLLPYSCAKFAFVGFSTGLSAEAKRDGIHVLTVVPGLMRTGSYLNAHFEGKTDLEFGWFGAFGNIPGVSVSAGHAARSIRRALQARRYTCTISLPAKVLIASENVFPEMTRTLMELTATHLLPAPDVGTGRRTGKSLNPKLGAWFQAITALGRSAARTLNE